MQAKLEMAYQTNNEDPGKLKEAYFDETEDKISRAKWKVHEGAMPPNFDSFDELVMNHEHTRLLFQKFTRKYHKVAEAYTAFAELTLPPVDERKRSKRSKK